MMDRRPISMIAALTLVSLALAATPAASACDADPSAWVTPCVSAYQIPVTTYTVDTTPETQTICPVSGVCYDVPRPTSLLVERTTWVTLYDVHAHANLDRMCNDIVGLVSDEIACAIATVAFVDAEPVTGVFVDFGTHALLLPATPVE